MKRLMNLVLMFSAISFVFVGVASAAGPPEIINPGGWKDDGSLVRLSEPSDSVSIGENSYGDYKLNVNVDNTTSGTQTTGAGSGFRINLNNHALNIGDIRRNKPHLVLENPYNDGYNSGAHRGMRMVFKYSNREWSIGPSGCTDGDYGMNANGLHDFIICRDNERMFRIDGRTTSASDNSVYISKLMIGGNSFDTKSQTSARLIVGGELMKVQNEGPDDSNSGRIRLGGSQQSVDTDTGPSAHIFGAGNGNYTPGGILTLSNNLFTQDDWGRWTQRTPGSSSFLTMDKSGFNFSAKVNSYGWPIVSFRIASDENVYFMKLVDIADNNYYTQPSQDSFFNRIYANTYNSISDIRLKENIKPLAKPLAKILKLNGVQFNWKDSKEGSKKESIGLIAQDVEKVFPEIVSSDKNGMKSVEYANLVAPLIEAIKEQQKDIESLRAEVEALRKKEK